MHHYCIKTTFSLLRPLPEEWAATIPAAGKLFPTDKLRARFPEVSLSRGAVQLSREVTLSRGAAQFSRDEVQQFSRDATQLSRDVMSRDVRRSSERWEDEEEEKVEKIRLQLEDVSPSVMLSRRVLKSGCQYYRNR